MMAQIEEENIANEPKLDFFFKFVIKFFSGGGELKNGGEFSKFGKNSGHIKNLVKLKKMRA